MLELAEPELGDKAGPIGPGLGKFYFFIVIFGRNACI
jgi:hypothetical protein